MSIKKLLVLAAAGLASSAALAGHVGYTAAPAPAMYDNTGVYLEGLVGYNRYAFEDSYGTLPDGSWGSWDNGTGNWAFGADIGYQFHRYMSVELGGIYTLRVSGIYTPEDSTGDSYKMNPWYAYLAGKLAVPVYDNVSVFTKLGVGYQRTKFSSDSSDTHKESATGAMFGAGVTYNFTPAVYMSGQWLRFTGKVKDGYTDNTAPNIFLLGLGYKFSM
jgi:opacity protein-like surface antigen